MFKVKKCAQCGSNGWTLLFDREISVSCQGCGQVYPQASIKRLPDDIEASRRIKISVEPMCKELTIIGANNGTSKTNN